MSITSWNLGKERMSVKVLLHYNDIFTKTQTQCPKRMERFEKTRQQIQNAVDKLLELMRLTSRLHLDQYFEWEMMLKVVRGDAGESHCKGATTVEARDLIALTTCLRGSSQRVFVRGGQSCYTPIGIACRWQLPITTRSLQARVCRPRWPICLHAMLISFEIGILFVNMLSTTEQRDLEICCHRPESVA